MQKVSQSRKQLTAADKKNQLATTSKLEKKASPPLTILWNQSADIFSFLLYCFLSGGWERRRHFVPLASQRADGFPVPTWAFSFDGGRRFLFFTENFVCAYLADVSRDGRTHLLDHCAVHLAAVYCPSRQSR